MLITCQRSALYLSLTICGKKRAVRLRVLERPTAAAMTMPLPRPAWVIGR